MSTPTPDLDALLTRYLHLLAAYTTLRTQLTALQSSLSLSLARASFTTPHQPGHYGPASYPSRMRASAVLTTSPSPDSDTPVFHLLPQSPSVQQTPKAADTAHDEPRIPTNDTGAPHTTDSNADEKPPAVPATDDPLRWFGILAPPALRDAQTHARAAAALVPRLAAVDAQMRGVEIEVRRARKRAAKLAKAEAAAIVVEGRAGEVEGEGRSGEAGEVAV